MTNVPEVKLAREAELCYATLALVTDYDVWHETEAEVTVEAVVANLMKNVATAKSVLKRVDPAAPRPRTCACPGLLRNAVITSPAAFPDSARRRLDILIGKYFPPTPPAPTAPPRRPAAPLRAPRRAAKATTSRKRDAPWLTSSSRAPSRSTMSAPRSARSHGRPRRVGDVLLLRRVLLHEREARRLSSAPTSRRSTSISWPGAGWISPGSRLPTARTFRWQGEYGYDLNEAKTLDTRLGVLADFKPDLPRHFRRCPYVFLANLDPVIQLDVLRSMERPRLAALDTMNFWIKGSPPSLRAVLGEVDALLVNDTEARMLAGSRSLVKAARTILGWGPRVVVVKRGEYGALMVTAEPLLLRAGLSTRVRRSTRPERATRSRAGSWACWPARGRPTRRRSVAPSCTAA